MKVKDLKELLERVDENLDIRFSLGDSFAYRAACAEIVRVEWEHDRNDSLADLSCDTVAVTDDDVNIRFGLMTISYYDMLTRTAEVINKKEAGL